MLRNIQSKAIHSGLARKSVYQVMYKHMSTHQYLTLPALSPTMESGNVAQWIVKPGSLVRPGDLIAEIQTDKAVVGFEAQEEFYLADYLVDAGDTQLSIGSPIAVIVDDEADLAEAQKFAIANKGKSISPAAPAAAPATPAAPAATPAAAPTSNTNNGSYNHVLPLSPAVSHMVHTDHIDISKIEPTGPKGRLLKGDVLAALESNPALKGSVKAAPKEDVKVASTASTASTPATPATSTPKTGTAPAAGISGRRAAARKFTDYPITPTTKDTVASMMEQKQFQAQSYFQIELPVTAVRRFLKTYAVEFSVEAVLAKCVAKAVSSSFNAVNVAVSNADTNSLGLVSNAASAPIAAFQAASIQTQASAAADVIVTLQSSPVAFARERVPAGYAVHVGLPKPSQKAVLAEQNALSVIDVITVTFTFDQAKIGDVEMLATLDAFQTYAKNPEALLL